MVRLVTRSEGVLLTCQAVATSYLERLAATFLAGLPASIYMAYVPRNICHIYDMGGIPLDLRNILPLIVATLLPFVPVVFMAIPLDTILAHVAGLLL